MKKILSLTLTFLMIMPLFLQILPEGVFAEGQVITETTESYTDSIGYGGYIVRTKSDGSIMMSPFLSQLKALVDGGADISDYTMEMTFSLLDGKGGNKVHTYDTVSSALNKSNGQYFDVYLNGSKGTTGFCPTAGKYYDIDVKIYKSYGKATQSLALYGTYLSAQIPANISSSKYYKPSAAPINANVTVSYSFNNELRGSAAGYIYVTTDASGTFNIGWGDSEGKALTSKAGEKVLPYSPLATFTIKDDKGGSHTEKVLGFTAIPVGAKTLLVSDASGKVLKAVELPADKLLEEKEPEYSFGVVSDVHFNYFFDDSKKIDYAENAFDTALEFYKAAGVELVAAAGDYSLYGEEESYKEFYEAVAKSGLLVIACGGNHELYAKLDVMFGKNGYWRKYMNTGIYDGKVEGVLDIADNGIDFTYQLPEHEDFVFISLSQWYWDGHSPAQEKLVEPEQLEWLEEQLELHKNKTVYLLFHTYLSDDDRENVDGQGDLKSNGGYSYNGNYNQHTNDEKIFRDLLTKYDNVIWYNGHSHYEFSMQKYNENLNIYNYQGTTATMVHVPSVTNPRTVASGATSYSSLAGDASQGILQFVYDDYQIINGVDLWAEEILSYACYIVYTDRDDVIEEGTITDTDTNITWTFNHQLNTLRFEGTGDIQPDYNLLKGFSKFTITAHSLYIGKGIKLIGKDAFSSFGNLKTIEIKEGLYMIKEGAFKSVPVETLILPESLKTIEKNAFSGIEKIENISYGGSAEAWEKVIKSEGNDVLSKSVVFQKVVITFVAGDMTVTYDVKNGTSPTYDELPSKYHEDENKHYPFVGWNDGTKTYKVTETLPKAKVNKTYTAVFGNEVDRYVSGKLNGGLVKWSLDRKTATLTVTGAGSIPSFNNNKEQPWYEYASEIRKVVVSGFKVIGNQSFCRLPALRTVVFEEGVTTLNMDCLAYNENLTEVFLPSTLKTVGQGTVYQSDNIKTIYYYGTEADWKEFCSNIKTMYNTNITGAENLIYLTHCTEDHVPSSWTYDKGSHSYTCEKCYKVSAPEKHTLGDWVIDLEATGTTDGQKSRSCKCGYTETEVIPATGVVTPTPSETPVNTTPNTTDVTEEPASDNTVIYVIIAVVAVLIIGGVVLVVALKKKKK